MDKDRIQELKQISILTFCSANNIPLRNRSGRYIKHADHDSLVIDTLKNTFYWNRKQAFGDIISFVQEYYSIGFQEAVELLDNFSYHGSVLSAKEGPTSPAPSCVFNLNEIQLSKDNKRLFAYLIKTRCLSSGTVEYFFKRKYIRQDINSNIVFFVYNDSKSIVGAYLRSTNTYQKFNYVYPGTPNCGIPVPFSNRPECVYYFEGFIDLMSFYEMHPDKSRNALFLSFNGLKDHCLEENMNKYPFARHVLAIDNDLGADNFYARIQETMSEKMDRIERLLPVHKDWNEDLLLTKNAS